jgi:hypothetical protein
VTGALYDHVRELPVEIESVELAGRSAETSYGFTRPTTVVTLAGAGATGVGEDVTTDPDAHERFQREGVGADLAGSYTLDEFSARVADLPPVAGDDWAAPGRARRWALESAALDLGLRQADTSLGARLDRTYDPVAFVVSLRLADPPSLDPIEGWRAIHPDLRFKLDVVPGWDAAFLADLAEVAGIEILDFKAQYGDGSDDDRVATDPDLYRAVVDAFSGATYEDPLFDDVHREVFAGHESQVSWDARITGVERVRDLPFEPSWLNVKPARFGSVASLFDTIEYALDRGITLYGGGMFELDRGRSHLHALASLFYPDGPNDVAPRGYNEPTPHEDVSPSPLAPPSDPTGIGF